MITANEAREIQFENIDFTKELEKLDGMIRAKSTFGENNIRWIGSPISPFDSIENQTKSTRMFISKIKEFGYKAVLVAQQESSSLDFHIEVSW